MQAVLSNERQWKIGFVEDFSRDVCSAIEMLVWIGFVFLYIRRRDAIDDDAGYRILRFNFIKQNLTEILIIIV
jgi:hypothetical protein